MEGSVQQVLKAVKEVIEQATYATFITVNSRGEPQARLVYPCPEEDEFRVIAITTHPATRKVAEVQTQPASALSYTAKVWQAYVTITGNTKVCTDSTVLQKYWRDDLSVYYSGGWQGGNFIVLQFEPQRIEIVSYHHSIATDPNRWQPLALLRKASSWTIEPQSTLPKQRSVAKL